MEINPESPVESRLIASFNVLIVDDDPFNLLILS